MDFIERIAPLAVKYMRQEKILASLTIAQAILESDSGKSELAVNANNLFGLKVNSTWKGEVYYKKTKDFKDGQWIEVTAVFCKFSSWEACVEYRSSVFLKKPQYKPLWGVMNYKDACRIIWECGYATDPNYPKKLIDLIEKYKLYEYDSEIQNKGVEKVDQKLTAGQEAIRQEAIRLGITDGKNPFREVNQFYVWACVLPIAKRLEELEQKLKNKNIV